VFSVTSVLNLCFSSQSRENLLPDTCHLQPILPAGSKRSLHAIPY
jgi:hypothetical protein